VSGIHPDEALALLAQVSQDIGSPITAMPSKGKALAGMYQRAEIYIHQLRLREAIAGSLVDDPDARRLYRAVVERGQAMSLLPLKHEDQYPDTFAPVLQRIEGDRWRVGLEGQGQTTEIDAPLADVVRAAQEIFNAWFAADQDRWNEKIIPLLKRTPQSLFHQYWRWQLRANEPWERGGGYYLTPPWHGHGAYRLGLPDSVRIISTDALRAVRICDALARRGKIEPPWPQPHQVAAWLTEQQDIPALERVGDGWQSGPVQVAWKRQGGGPPCADLRVGEQGYALLVTSKEITLHPTRQGKPARGKKLAVTALEPPLRDWLRGDEGRGALAMWAIWAGKLGVGE
jgi:hypothetical protein